LVSGKPVTSPEPLDSSRVVTNGSTSFVVGAKDGLWPAQVIPSQKNEGRAAEHNGPSQPDDHSKDQGGTSPLRILLISLVALSLIIFAISVFSAKGTRKPADPEYPGKVEKQIEEHTELRAGDSIEELEQTFRRVMPSIKTFRNTNWPHGELVVLTPDEDSTLKARQLAGNARKAIYVQVVNLAEVNSLLREISHMRAPQVSAVLQPDGTLLWKGYLRSRSEFPKLKDEERQDLPFLGKDEDRILYGEELVPKISSILSTSGIGAGITVKPEDKGLVLTGEISPDTNPRLNESLEKIATLYPDMHLDNKVGSAAGGTEIETILGGRVAGVTFGKSAWIELTNGIRLFPGTRLANGMTLLGINQREISFQTPGGIMKMSVESVTAQPAPGSKH